MQELDNRGLQPPEPMVRILTAAEALSESDVLVVLNDRRPVHLYPILEARGYDCQTEDLDEGGVRLTIRRQPSASSDSRS